MKTVPQPKMTWIFYCPYSYTLGQYVEGYLESNPSSDIEFLSRDYTALPYLTIRHNQTVGLNDLSCLDLDPFCLSLNNSQLL